MCRKKKENLKGFAEVVYTLIINSVEIYGYGGSSSGTIDDLTATFYSNPESCRISNVSYHNLHGSWKHVHNFLIRIPY